MLPLPPSLSGSVCQSDPLIRVLPYYYCNYCHVFAAAHMHTTAGGRGEGEISMFEMRTMMEEREVFVSSSHPYLHVLLLCIYW